MADVCLVPVISKDGSRASSVVREAGRCVVVVPVIIKDGSRASYLDGEVGRCV